MVASTKSHVKLLRTLLLLIVVGVLSSCVTTPPFQEMSDARQAIAAAEEAGAQQKSPRLFSLAQKHLQKAKDQIADRTFGLARSNAVLARQRAVEALTEIQQNSL